MSKKDELVKLILENETIKRYKELEKVILSQEILKEQIQKLKKIQKELVNATQLDKLNLKKQLQAKYDEMLEEINDFPLISEYLALQSEINYTLQEIFGIIETGINQALE